MRLSVVVTIIKTVRSLKHCVGTSLDLKENLWALTWEQLQSRYMRAWAPRCALVHEETFLAADVSHSHHADSSWGGRDGWLSIPLPAETRYCWIGTHRPPLPDREENIFERTGRTIRWRGVLAGETKHATLLHQSTRETLILRLQIG
jgi:hypothetical protein